MFRASLLAIASLAAPIHAQPAPAPLAAATLARSDGAPAGTVALGRRDGHVVLTLNLTGLTPGEHGLHFHAVGACDGPDFKTAGGHLNPEGHQHGMLNAMGHHLGDLPNITADTQGHVVKQVELDQGADALMAQIFDADGTAIVVHATADDYRTDPSGNSGARIACGVLKKP